MAYGVSLRSGLVGRGPRAVGVPVVREWGIDFGGGEGRGEEGDDVLDDVEEGRGGLGDAAREGGPLALAGGVGGEGRGEAGRRGLRERGLRSGEGGAEGLCEFAAIEGEVGGEESEVEIVFEAGVEHAEAGDCFCFFSDDGGRGIGTKERGRLVEEDGKGVGDGGGCNGVAKANVDLQA